MPIAVSLFSNSPIRGKLNGFASYRTHIWQHTDSKIGLIHFFDDSNSYEQYCDFVVPMYFVKRNNEIIDCSGKDFNNFINGKLGEVCDEANIEDWPIIFLQYLQR